MPPVRGGRSPVFERISATDFFSLVWWESQ
jgi:hypothetical protein